MIYAEFIKAFPKAGVGCLQQALTDMFQEAEALSAYCVCFLPTHTVCVQSHSPRFLSVASINYEILFS